MGNISFRAVLVALGFGLLLLSSSMMIYEVRAYWGISTRFALFMGAVSQAMAIFLIGYRVNHE